MTGFIRLPANFKRKRAPSTKPRSHEEDDLQESVAAYLNWALMPPATYTAIAHGVSLSGKTIEARRRAGMRLKKKGLKPGWPDFIFAFNFRGHGIELKSGRGVVSDDQERVHKELIAAGWTIAICRSLDEVIARLKLLGIPLRTEKPSTTRLREAGERLGDGHQL